MKTYNVIGLMSGTSCDGLDIAFCQFIFKNEKWSFDIVASKMVEYSSDWRTKLKNTFRLSNSELTKLDTDLGIYFGNETKQFIEENKLTCIDFIASHGHTIFHKPDEDFTLQIACGKEIKKAAGLPVINDFRSADVAAGGQGAPLVPIGDELLFSEFDYCLNIGGIANISYKENGIRKAKDVCFANMALNPLALEMGYEYDDKGHLAAQGVINPQLLWKLQALDFDGKSLGIEQYNEFFLPILEKSPSIAETKIATVTEYLALKIAEKLTENSTLLITGGGAYNLFLIEKIKQYSKANVVKASKELIEFKEALIFAFLGVLKMENIPNCLASVTGAKEDVVGGVLVE